MSGLQHRTAGERRQCDWSSLAYLQHKGLGAELRDFPLNIALSDVERSACRLAETPRVPYDGIKYWLDIRR
jgi:hypothetical protein